MRFFVSAFFVFIGSLGSAIAQQKDINALELGMCFLPQIADIPLPNESLNPDNIHIVSKATQIERNQMAYFGGGVTLFNKGARVSADEIEVSRLTESFRASGNIHFQRNSINVFADSLSVEGARESTELSNANYQLTNHPGHGSAKKLEINTDGELLLLDSTFTTCFDEVPDWQLSSSKIFLSESENIGEAYNSSIRIKGIPVFYLPYITFPVNNKRKSGFIDPVLDYSGNSGAKISAPYYFNIAPNYDATLAPVFMSKRGVQLVSEFRYLVNQQYGEIDLEYLNNDNELINNNDPRYLARWQHIGSMSDNFRLFVDFSYVSDDYYLVDIGSSEFNRSDSYLTQMGEIGYFAENWHTKIKLQDYAVLGTHTNSYKTIPQIELHRSDSLGIGLAKFDFYAEYNHFDTPDKWLPTADRFHVETGLNIPYNTPGWFFNSELKILQTNYHQSRLVDDSKLEESVSRTLPKVRLHGGLNFDRLMQGFNNQLTQTLEPQMQYLYIPFKDQSTIGLYDTTLLQDDFAGLFRDKRYSGLDRIAEADQISWGVTSRILDRNNQELFHLSLGRIVYLHQSSEERVNSISDEILQEDKSALAAELFFQLDKRWQLNGEIQYNTDTNVTDKGQLALDYYHNEKHFFQLNHRYAKAVSGSSIEQMSMFTTFAINKDWQLVGRYTRDLVRSRAIDTYIGLQYETCCWAVRIGYKRHINTNLDEQGFIDQNRDEFNSGPMLSFVIKGLGGRQSNIGIQEMFNQGIFGYKRPYFLNN